MGWRWKSEGNITLKISEIKLNRKSVWLTNKHEVVGLNSGIHSVQGFFSGINNPKSHSWWAVYSTEESIDNGAWSLWFVVHPLSMQFVGWSFVARCLTKFHLCIGVLLEFCLRSWYREKTGKGCGTFLSKPQRQTVVNQLNCRFNLCLSQTCFSIWMFLKNFSFCFNTTVYTTISEITSCNIGWDYKHA